MDLISVIIPVYNTKKYLPKCLDSVINQTYKNLQIIIVNDGSTDDSLRICKDYSHTDSRIIIIDKKNGGLSDARNVGLEAATGKYVFFLDSDDYINKQAIELMYSGSEYNNSDVAICDYQMVSGSDEYNIPKIQVPLKWNTLNGEEAVKNLLSGKPFYSIAWNKLYRREIFQNIRFPIGKINEDEFVAHKTLSVAKKVIYTNQKLYVYVQHEQSIMSKYSFRRHNKAEAFKERIDYLNGLNYTTEIVKLARFRYLIEELNFRYNIRKTNLSVQERIMVKHYLKTARKEYFNHFFDFSFMQHLKLYAICFFPKLYRYLRGTNGQS